MRDMPIAMTMRLTQLVMIHDVKLPGCVRETAGYEMERSDVVGIACNDHQVQYEDLEQEMRHDNTHKSR